MCTHVVRVQSTFLPLLWYPPLPSRRHMADVTLPVVAAVNPAKVPCPWCGVTSVGILSTETLQRILDAKKEAKIIADALVESVSDSDDDEVTMERTGTVVLHSSESTDSIPIEICTPIERHGCLPSFPAWSPPKAWSGNNPDSIRQGPLAQGLPNPALKKKDV